MPDSMEITYEFTPEEYVACCLEWGGGQ